MSPDVIRVAGNEHEPEGFKVTTKPPDGDKYVYTLEVTGEDTVGCVRKRYFDGEGGCEELEPEATASVENAVSEYGFSVE